jgi:diguanylate cyclase (GGDEF)-like protein
MGWLLRLWARVTAQDAFFSLTGLGHVTSAELAPVLATRRHRNASTLRYVAAMVGLLLVVQFFVILIDSDMTHRPGVREAYLSLFAFGSVVSMVAILAWNLRPHTRGQGLYVFCVLVEGVGITLCDIQISGDISTYILVLFGTALLWSAPLSWYLAAFGASWGALLVGMAWTAPRAIGLTALAGTGVLTVVGLAAAVILEVRRIQTELLTIELERRNKEFREASLRDSLTGLHNRRFLFEWIEKQLSRSRRSGRPLTVVLMDLDHFKTVNDTAGHSVGDEVLRQAARWLLASLRDSDVVARYGGEEFVAVLPDTSAEPARAVLERCLDLFRTSRAEGWHQELTFSAGLTVLTADDTVETLFRRADDLLYRAKAAGRNRICVG